MGQEFFIKSDTIEDKIRKTLPSQGGLGQGIDLSASTTIVPVIDITESAEGSVLRQDLQTSFSLTAITAFVVSNTTSTLINTTGYYRVYGVLNTLSANSLRTARFTLTDGITSKRITQFVLPANTGSLTNFIVPYDFTVFIEAGESLTATSDNASTSLEGNTRQIATVDGELVNP
jgi:hypothetical protein